LSNFGSAGDVGFRYEQRHVRIWRRHVRIWRWHVQDLAVGTSGFGGGTSGFWQRRRNLHQDQVAHLVDSALARAPVHRWMNLMQTMKQGIQNLQDQNSATQQFAQSALVSARLHHLCRPRRIPLTARCFRTTAALFQQISHTPLVPVQLSEDTGRIWCKLEFLNPSGSTKDRIARYILEKQWRTGRLRKGDTVYRSIERIDKHCTGAGLRTNGTQVHCRDAGKA